MIQVSYMGEDVDVDKQAPPTSFDTSSSSQAIETLVRPIVSTCIGSLQPEQWLIDHMITYSPNNTILSNKTKIDKLIFMNSDFLLFIHQLGNYFQHVLLKVKT